MSDTDMIGKLVRWENRGQWFTARVTGGDGGSGRGSLVGEVVDPGNYIGVSGRVGEQVPNLRPELLTVMDEKTDLVSREVRRVAMDVAHESWANLHPAPGDAASADFQRAVVATVVAKALDATAPLILAAWAEKVATDMPYPKPMVDSYSQGRRDAQDHLLSLASVLRGEGQTNG